MELLNIVKQSPTFVELFDLIKANPVYWCLVIFSCIAISIIFVAVMVGILSIPTFKYKGKHVLITGGSSGIGLEMAKEYLNKGANVTILARNKQKLIEAIALLHDYISTNALVSKVLYVSCDTSSKEDIIKESLVECIVQFGDISVLVNCAGVSIASSFEETPIDEFERMLRINVMGSIIPTRAVLSSMKKLGTGRIIFVASQVAQVAMHGYTAYAASKWALRGLAEALQMEVKPYGIFVSVAYPPDTDTPGYKNEMETKPLITKTLSESGVVFTPQEVAYDIVNQSTKGYFGISNGLDGWLLKMLHPGMTPINHVCEVIQHVLFSPIARFIAIFYIYSWDNICKNAKYKEDELNSKKNI